MAEGARVDEGAREDEGARVHDSNSSSTPGAGVEDEAPRNKSFYTAPQKTRLLLLIRESPSDFRSSMIRILSAQNVFTELYLTTELL